MNNRIKKYKSAFDEAAPLADLDDELLAWEYALGAGRWSLVPGMVDLLHSDVEHVREWAESEAKPLVHQFVCIGRDKIYYDSMYSARECIDAEKVRLLRESKTK